MKFVFISRHGDILPLAQRVEAEGNEVIFFLSHNEVWEDEPYVLDKHIIEIGPDVIVIDSPGFGKLATKLKKLGFPVVGASLLSDVLTTDVNYHNRFIRACGLNIDSMNTLPNSIPIEIEGWFSGKDFTAAIYTVNSVTFPGSKTDKLYKQSLISMVNALKRNGYVGPISIKGYINSDNIQFNVVKAHFTTSTMLALMEGLKSNVSIVINGLANGSNRWLMFKPGYFIAIELILSPNAILETERYHNSHVRGLMPENLKHMWVYGLKKNGDGYIYNGENGRFGVVTARGDSISEARRRAIRTIEGKIVQDSLTHQKRTQGGIHVDNMLYLKGVGNKADFQHSRLLDWGWLS